MHSTIILMTNHRLHQVGEEEARILMTLGTLLDLLILLGMVDLHLQRNLAVVMEVSFPMLGTCSTVTSMQSVSSLFLPTRHKILKVLLNFKFPINALTRPTIYQDPVTLLIFAILAFYLMYHLMVLRVIRLAHQNPSRMLDLSRDPCINLWAISQTICKSCMEPCPSGSLLSIRFADPKSAFLRRVPRSLVVNLALPTFLFTLPVCSMSSFTVDLCKLPFPFPRSIRYRAI